MCRYITCITCVYIPACPFRDIGAAGNAKELEYTYNQMNICILILTSYIDLYMRYDRYINIYISYI